MWKIFKISFLILLAVVVIFSVVEIAKDSPESILKGIIKKGPLEGDAFKFKAKFLGVVTAGSAVISNEGKEAFEEKEVYHLSARGQSANWISPFFKAEALCDSYTEKNKLHSLLFKMHIVLSDHPTEDKIISYDQENLIMDTGEERRQILPNTHDPLSLMFYLRNQEFKLGKEFDLNINTNQKNYQFKTKIVDKVTYQAADKDIDVWIVKAEVKRRGKSKRNKSSVTMWLLDNQSKTPILFKVMTPIGPITIRLTEIQ